MGCSWCVPDSSPIAAEIMIVFCFEHLLNLDCAMLW